MLLSVTNWTIYLQKEKIIKEIKRNIKNLKIGLIFFIIKTTKLTIVDDGVSVL